MAAARLARARAEITAFFEESPPDSLDGARAMEVAQEIATIERLLANGKLRYASRVEATDAFVDGGWRNASSWVGSISGQPLGQARSALEAAKAIAESPAGLRAFEEGRLSVPQAAQVAKVVGTGEANVESLIEAAQENKSTFVDFRRRAERMAQGARSAEDDAARDARINAARFLRLRKGEDGGMHGEFFLTCADGALVMSRLTERADRFREIARKDGDPEPRDRYMADALVDLMMGTRREKYEGPSTTVQVHVDVAALRRGSVEPGERCEIAGVGPISVASARQLMGDAYLRLIVDDGIDVHAISTTTRTVPAGLERALSARDIECVIPGCDEACGLQNHHWLIDFVVVPFTSIDSLARVCPVHHRRMSKGEWRLIGGPGKWEYIHTSPAQKALYDREGKAKAIALARAAAIAKGSDADSGGRRRKGPIAGAKQSQLATGRDPDPPEVITRG